MLIKSIARIARFTLVLAVLNACLSTASSAQESTAPALENQLVANPSPYLALHGGDPVAWQTWGKAALALAKKHNKPLFISSGYFSCHWCHVMQTESYQNAAVAQWLNSHFIPIKIDRELESALDQRLMDYAQATLKTGGWPLNVFLSPDGLPLYAVLYQPREEFENILQTLAEAWPSHSARLADLAKKQRTAAAFPDAEPLLDAAKVRDLLATSVDYILGAADDLQGGFGEANKFPSVPQLFFLLEQQAVSNHQPSADFLRTTLDAMAAGGLMDQLSGGFYRYSVDPAWQIPHFEKMLYDNANLARLYLHAGNVLQEARYTAIAVRTLDFMLDNMVGDNGALLAAFSAVDAQGIEGGYYLWTQQALARQLNPNELAVFNATWNMNRPNDLEAGSHLRDAKSIAELAEVLEQPENTPNENNPKENVLQQTLASAHNKLLQARAQRILPVDDKYLAAWNGLALTAFSEAAQRLNKPKYRQQAKQIQSFIIADLWDGEQLSRGIAKGQTVGSAAIEDYAYVAQGLLAFSKLSGRQQDVQLAAAVLNQAWRRFYQNNAWNRADGSLLPAVDGVELMPGSASASPAAVIIQTSLALAAQHRKLGAQYQQQALSALNRGQATLRQQPFWFVSQLSAMQQAIAQP